MPESFGIMTDSGADFSPEYQKEHDLILIPTRILVAGEEYIDRENITREEIINKMLNEKAKTSTSIAPPAEFHRIINESLEKYEKILYIAISSKMSATYQNAILTAKRLETNNFVAIDTESVSWGMSLLIDHAVLRRVQGVKIEQVAEELKKMIQNLKLFFMVDTLEYLRRGGRIGAAKSLLGKLIGAKPLLAVQDKEVASIGTVKSFTEGIDHFYKIIKEKSDEYKNCTIALIYGLETPEFKEFAVKIKHEFKPLKFYYEPIGANIISHAGPKLFGIGILKIPEDSVEAYK